MKQHTEHTFETNQNCKRQNKHTRKETRNFKTNRIGQDLKTQNAHSKLYDCSHYLSERENIRTLRKVLLVQFLMEMLTTFFSVLQNKTH